MFTCSAQWHHEPMAKAIVPGAHEPSPDATRVEPRLPEGGEQVSWDLAMGLGFGVLARWLDLWVSRTGPAR
jgi:hypothetical protein